jgi:hypothetical protein
MRALLRLGLGALALLGVMVVSSLLLWVGIPLAWLWVASQIQGASGSVGAAIGAAFVGVTVSIALMVPALSALSRAYRRARVGRGLEDTGNFALEVVMVLTAGAAILVFGAWFFFFAGASPIPIGISY